MLLVNDDLRELAQRAGLDKDPAVRALINSPLLPREKKAKLARYLGAVAAVRCPDPHPFLPAPPRELAEKGIAQIGRVVTGMGPEYPKRFGENDFLTHMQVDGSTGVGKTLALYDLSMQVHRAGPAVWWFDTEGDLTGYVVAQAPDVLVVNHRDIRMALFDGPRVEGLQSEEYLTKLIASFKDTLYALHGMQNMCREICLGLRQRLGSFTIFDFHEALVRRKYKVTSREGGYWESLVNRFGGGLLPILGKTYGSGSHNFEALMRRSIVWQLHELSPDMLRFFVTVLLLWVYLASPVTTSPRLLLLLAFDEFTRVCSEDSVPQSGLGENMMLDFMRTCRKRQIGVMLATQTPHLLPKQVLSLTNTWIVMRPTDGHFLRCVAQSLDLNADQQQCLMQLPDRGPRRAVVRCPGWPEPFLVELPEH